MHPLPKSNPPARFLAGVFLVALAALALFDLWFPGLWLVLGGVAILYDVMRQQRTRPWQVGWLLVAAGGLLWLRASLSAHGLGSAFVVLLLVLGSLLAFTVDIGRFLRL